MDYNKAALEMHESHHGKVGIVSKVEVRTRDDLSTAYTPGVAEPAARSKRTPTTCTSTPSRATWWPSCPTAPPCWAWATSAPKPVCRSWRQGRAVQGIRRRGCLPHLHRCPRRCQRHCCLQGHCAHLWRHQSGGHQEPECFEIEETLERELDILCSR